MAFQIVRTISNRTGIAVQQEVPYTGWPKK